MKNVFMFLRFAVTALIICLIYDFIANKKIALNKQQVLTSVIIAIILGSVFTVIFFYKTCIVSRQSVDLEKLKIELTKNDFKLIKENTTELCFRGNISYLFFVGDIKISILNREIKISGTKYILNKITKGMVIK